ncbi:outer membrane beta-barrel protein [Vibrio sp. HN007]|uniref:outer membrane beta-barrel protein n=1 Tax=Vibrio iocasae TaxID=3098914 RepID=UPI0035D405D7
MSKHTKPVGNAIPILLIASISAPVVYADTQPKVHSGPLGMEYLMSVGADYGHEENITLQSNPDDAINSNFYSVSPEFRMQSQFNDDVYSLSYSGDFKEYESSAEDSYQDHKISSENLWRFGTRHQLELNLSQSWDHEVRGDDSTGDLSNEQLEYYGVEEALLTESTVGSLNYKYGALNSRGALEMGWSYRDMTFRDLDSVASNTSTPDFIDYLKGEEWASSTLSVGISDNYSSDTTFRYSLIRHHIMYKANSEKDTYEYYLRMGIKSNLSSTVSLDGNISWLHKTFINLENADSFDGFNWDANLIWEPEDYSIWRATTSQVIDDASVGGEYTLKTSAGINWQHYWGGDRFSTLAGYEYILEKHKKQDSDREDSSNQLSLTLSYDLRPSVNFSLQYLTLTEDSNHEYDNFYISETHNPITQLGYDQSKLVLTAKVQI